MLDVSRFAADGVGVKEQQYVSASGSVSPSNPSFRVYTFTITFTGEPVSVSLINGDAYGSDIAVNLPTDTIASRYHTNTNSYDSSSKTSYVYTAATKTIAITIDLNSWTGLTEMAYYLALVKD